MIQEGPQSEAPVACILTSEELEQFRGLLLAKRRDLLGDLTGMTAEARGAGPGEEPSGDSMQQQKFADESDDREITIGLLASERVLLQEISEALERIKEGTYGICAATGEPIGKDRLLARPWAKYCIAYARTMEKGGRSAGAYSRRRVTPDTFDDDEGGPEPRDLRSIAGGDE